MNQAILFNDDISFNKTEDAWCFTGLISGQQVVIYFHSMELKQLHEIDSCTKFDLEELTELWLEKNELEGDVIHLNMK
jgi:purine-nucleoside phosphorylase